MSRKGREAALAAAVEFYGGTSVTKSADGQEKVFALAAYLEPAFSTLDKLEKHSRAQAKALREQEAQITALEGYLQAFTLPGQGVHLGAAETHRRAIATQMSHGQHFRDLEADGQLAALRGLTATPVSPWSYLPEVNGHNLAKPSSNGHAQPPPGHPEASGGT